MSLMRDSKPLQKVLTNLTQQDIRQWQEMKDPDWISVLGSITKLFQLRRMPDLIKELPLLNEKITKFSKSDIGPFLGEYYQDQILKKCMIILREDVREENGNVLLTKLADVWTQFFTSILPTLQAIFATVELKISIRTITLLSFRDIVLLKTAIEDALDNPEAIILPQIKQMLLVLQSVHRTPMSDQYYDLQRLVGKAVNPYMVMNRPNKSPSTRRKKPSRGGSTSISFTEHDFGHNRSSSVSNIDEAERIVGN